MTFDPERSCGGCGAPGEVVGDLNEHDVCSVCEANVQRFLAASKELETFIAAWIAACQKRGMPVMEISNALENAYYLMDAKLDEQLPKAA